MDSTKFSSLLKRVICTWKPKNQLKFLKIYPAFGNATRLITTWITIYQDYIDYTNAKTNEKLTTDVVYKKDNILSFLLTGLANDLIENDMGEIVNILEMVINEEPEFINSIKLYHTKLFVKPIGRSKSSCLSEDISYKPKRVTNSIRKELALDNLSNFTAMEIAYELTRMQSELLQKVTVKELINFSKDNYNPQLCANLKEISNNFQKLTQYVKTEILSDKYTNKERSQFIKKMVAVAVQCKDMNNFDGLFAIVSALNCSYIRKLSDLWDPKKKYMKTLGELENLVYPLRNFANYREFVSTIKNKSCIPYVAVFVTDIKHIMDNGLYNKKTGKLNDKIFDALAKTIESFEAFNKRYDIPMNKQICDFIGKIEYREDERSLDDSLKRVLEKQSQKKGLFSPKRESSDSNKLKKMNLGTLQIPSSPPLARMKSEQSIFTDSNEKMKFRKSVNEKIPDRRSTLTQVEKPPMFIRERSSSVIGMTNETHNNSRSKMALDLRIIEDNKIITAESPRKIQKSTKSPRKAKSLDSQRLDPRNVEKWSNNDVSLWLTQIGMQEYKTIFHNNRIDGFSLVELTEDHLKEMNVTKLGHRITIIKRIQILKSQK